MMPLTADALRQMVDQNDEKHEEGHERHRRRLDELEKRIGDLEERRAIWRGEVEERLKRFASEPMDLARINVPPRLVVSVITVCLLVGGGFYASTYGLKSDVRDILTQMQAQKSIEASNARLTEERSAVLNRTIDMIEKKQELQRLEIQSLRETILRQRSGQ